MAWSGLGMGTFTTPTEADFDSCVSTLKSYGISNIRVDIPDFTADLTQSKAGVVRAISEGMNVIWGVSSGSTTLTDANWSAYSDAVLSAALWAEQNGVYEFQIGNELELKNDDDTLTDAEVRDGLKVIATAAQAIYTIGNISYSADQGQVSAWNDLGRGDIDLVAFNVYRGSTAGTFSNNWITNITNMVSYFGADHTYLTEWALSTSAISAYSADTDIQARETGVMLEKIQDLGITRAYYFQYSHADLGVISSYGSSPRSIWNVLTTNNGRKWFIV